MVQSVITHSCVLFPKARVHEVLSMWLNNVLEATWVDHEVICLAVLGGCAGVPQALPERRQHVRHGLVALAGGHLGGARLQPAHRPGRLLPGALRSRLSRTPCSLCKICDQRVVSRCMRLHQIISELTFWHSAELRASSCGGCQPRSCSRLTVLQVAVHVLDQGCFDLEGTFLYYALMCV